MNKDRNLVWYHENCLDGSCSAWVASNYLARDVTEYVAQNYGKPIKKSLCVEEVGAENVTLYILDWCPESMDKLQDLCNMFKKIILIDHHASAIKKLMAWKNNQVNGNFPSNLEDYLAHENEWSGARGTAHWFAMQPKTSLVTPYDLSNHWLVRAVDDRDRWKFKLKHTREINAALFCYGMDWNTWPWSADIPIKDGAILLRQQEQHITQVISACTQEIENDKDETIGMFCNCNHMFHSEVGNRIVQDKKYRIAILWYLTADYKVYISFRSAADNPVAINCSELAVALGGGGHVNAAGCKIALPPQQAFELVVKELGRIA